MAIQISFTDPSIAGGNTFSQAYCHIDMANMPDLNQTLNVVVGLYVDQAHFAAGNRPFFSKTVALSAADAAALRAQFAAAVYQMLTSNPTPTPGNPNPAPYPPFNGGLLVP